MKSSHAKTLEALRIAGMPPHLRPASGPNAAAGQAPAPDTSSGHSRPGVDADTIYASRREQAASAAGGVDWDAVAAAENAKLPTGAIIPGAAGSKGLDPTAIYSARQAQTEAAQQLAASAGLVAEAIARMNAEGKRSSAGFRTAYETYAARRAQTGDR